jgi:hypothetical protein
LETGPNQKIQIAGYGGNIKFQRRPGILGFDFHARLHGYRADTHIWDTIYPHQTIGTMTAKTKQAPRAMILEAAAENPQARSIQGGSDGFTRETGNRFTIEFKRDGLSAGNFKVGMVRYSQIICHFIHHSS